MSSYANKTKQKKTAYTVMVIIAYIAKARPYRDKLVWR